MLGPSAIYQINSYQELALDLGANTEDQKIIHTASGDRLLVKFVKTKTTPNSYPRHPKKLKRLHNL